MQVALVEEPYDIEILDLEIPKIEKGNEVLVRTKRVGICGSDIHIYHGTNPFAIYPRVIGHEVAGEVIKVGEHVAALTIADDVVVGPLKCCGMYQARRSGGEMLCRTIAVC